MRVTLARRLRYDLPRDVALLQAGLVVNAFGNGAVAPFMIIFLHDARGIALPLAGLASAVGASTALGATLLSGSLASRTGPRATMLGGLTCSAVAYLLYPYVSSAWAAVALAVLAGAGIGTWLTMQSSLLALLVPRQVRHVAFAWQRVAANVGLGLGGFAGGFIVVADRPSTFHWLFWLNAMTFVGYGIIVGRIRLTGGSRPAPAQRRDYRQVLRDHTFVRLAAVNVVIVLAAISLLVALLPVYARNELHIGERVIGGLFLLNSLAIIGLQVPLARAVEGHRRMSAFALLAALFAGAWLVVASAGWTGHTMAIGLLVLAVLAISVAECVYDAVYPALVADLAPTELLPRYLAVSSFSWQLGFIIGPLLGAVILAAAPVVLWLVAAGLCVAAAAGAMALDRRLPARSRLTPRRVPATPVVPVSPVPGTPVVPGSPVPATPVVPVSPDAGPQEG